MVTNNHSHRKRHKLLSKTKRSRHCILKIFLLHLLILTPSHRSFYHRVLVVNFLHSLSSPVLSQENAKAVYPESLSDTVPENEYVGESRSSLFVTMDRTLEKATDANQKTTTGGVSPKNNDHNITIRALAERNARRENDEPVKTDAKIILDYEAAATVKSNSKHDLNLKLNVTESTTEKRVCKESNDTVIDLFINLQGAKQKHANELLALNKTADVRSPALVVENTGALAKDRPFVLSSCYERCGDLASFPCSCDERCVVYNHCCKDLSQACPTLYQLAMHKFKALRSATSRCDQTTGVFMVNSCNPTKPLVPREVGEKNNFTSLHDLSTGSPAKPSKDALGKDDPILSKLLEIIVAAPVTDLSTGIVYANASIYQCNTPVSSVSNKVRDSLKASWLVQLASIPRAADTVSTEISTISALLNSLDLTNFLYFPPEVQRSSLGVVCLNEDVLSCISQRSLEMSNRDIVCNISAINYYENARLFEYMANKNDDIVDLICAQCFLLYQIAQRPANIRFYMNRLRILASLSKVTGQIEFDKTDFSELSVLPWSSWTCNKSSNIAEENTGGKCQILQCDEQFTLIQKTYCRKTVTVELVLNTDFIVENTKCMVNVQALAHAIQCHLQTKYSLKLLQKTYNILNSFDGYRHANMSVLTLSMYLDQHLYIQMISDLYYDYYEQGSLFAAVKFFIQRRCSFPKDMTDGNLIQDKDKVPHDALFTRQKSAHSESEPSGKVNGTTNKTEPLSGPPNQNKNETVEGETSKFMFCLLLKTDSSGQELHVCDDRSRNRFLKEDITKRTAFSVLENVQCVHDESERKFDSRGCKKCKPHSSFIFGAVLLVQAIARYAE